MIDGSSPISFSRDIIAARLGEGPVRNCTRKRCAIILSTSARIFPSVTMGRAWLILSERRPRYAAPAPFAQDETSPLPE
jgi:hypothetical protein